MPGLSPAARAAVEAGIPEETRRGYAGDWQRFLLWCGERGHVPPTSGDVLTEYAAALTLIPRPRTGRPYAPASIQRALASIAVAHKAAGFAPPPTAGALLVLRGYTARLHRTKDSAAAPCRAAAATPDLLRRMVAALPATLAGRRDAAALLLGFSTAARRSELRLLNWTDLAEVKEGLAVRIYRPKVTKLQPIGVPYGPRPDLCPVRAIRDYRHLLADAGREPVGPVFVRIDRHGRIAPPLLRRGVTIGDPTGRVTGEAIGDIVARAARQAGLDRPDQLLADGPPRWSGHSLRRGFATAAKRAGADFVETARHGGWADTSASLAGYFEEAGTWDESNPLYRIGLQRQ